MKIRSMMKRALAGALALSMVFGASACGKKSQEETGPAVVEGGEQFMDYLISIMDTNYKNNSEKYRELTGASEEDALSTYEGSCQEVGFMIQDALSVKRDIVTADRTTEFVNLAKAFYGQTKYEAISAMREEDNDYTVSLTITPVDFYGTVGSAFEAAVDNWNQKAKNGELDDFTESQYEEAYATDIVQALIPTIQAVKYKDTVTVDVTLDYNDATGNYVVSDEDMDALGATVLSMAR